MADELTPLPELLEDMKRIKKELYRHRAAIKLTDGWSATRWNNLHVVQICTDDAAHLLGRIIENDKKKEQEND